jgi:hypothetical protein
VADEVPPEGLDAVRGDVEPGRHPMPAVAAEVRRAGSQGGVQVERRDAATRAAPGAVPVERDHDARSAMALDEPRGDDPDHPRVPVLAGEHVRGLVGVRGERGLGREGDPHLGVLALLVEQVELTGYFACPRVVGREQQLERGVRAPHPPGRVDARAEAEPEPARVECARVARGDPHQGAQARLAGARDRLQSLADDAAVLADERHDVADRREGDEVEVLLGVLRGGTSCGGQRLRELVRDAGRAQVGERVATERRVHDRAVRQRLARAVVVGDDDLYAERARVRDLLDRGDAAVDRDEQLGPRRRLALDARDRQAVAVLEAAGQLAHRGRAEALERPCQDRRGADAVNVVVAVDDDPRAARDMPHQDLDRGGQTRHQSRVVAIGRCQKETRGLRGVVSAPDEDRRRDGMKPELPR